MNTTACTITADDALAYFVARSTVYANARVEGEAAYPDSDKYEGVIGMRVTVELRYDDEYRGFTAGERIGFVVICRPTARGMRRCSSFDAQTLERARTAVAAYHARMNASREEA